MPKLTDYRFVNLFIFVDSSRLITIAPVGELRVAQQSLAVGQLQLHEDDRQATIDVLGQQWPAEIRTAIKSLGVEWNSAAGHLGTPTAAELRAAWKAYRLDQRITNAAALLRERISPEMSADEAAAVVVAAAEPGCVAPSQQRVCKSGQM